MRGKEKKQKRAAYTRSDVKIQEGNRMSMNYPNCNQHHPNKSLFYFFLTDT